MERRNGKEGQVTANIKTTSNDHGDMKVENHTPEVVAVAKKHNSNVILR
jgi:hypothetical protein